VSWAPIQARYLSLLPSPAYLQLQTRYAVPTGGNQLTEDMIQRDPATRTFRPPPQIRFASTAYRVIHFKSIHHGPISQHRLGSRPVLFTSPIGESFLISAVGPVRAFLAILTPANGIARLKGDLRRRTKRHSALPRFPLCKDASAKTGRDLQLISPETVTPELGLPGSLRLISPLRCRRYQDDFDSKLHSIMSSVKGHEPRNGYKGYRERF